MNISYQLLNFFLETLLVVVAIFTVSRLVGLRSTVSLRPLQLGLILILVASAMPLLITFFASLLAAGTVEKVEPLVVILHWMRLLGLAVTTVGLLVGCRRAG